MLSSLVRDAIDAGNTISAARKISDLRCNLDTLETQKKAMVGSHEHKITARRGVAESIERLMREKASLADLAASLDTLDRRYAGIFIAIENMNVAIDSFMISNPPPPSKDAFERAVAKLDREIKDVKDELARCCREIEGKRIVGSKIIATTCMGEYTVVKKLGRGEKGEVFLVRKEKGGKKGKEYAMKTEPALFERISPEQKREIDFSILFANKYPDQFMKLHEWYVKDGVLYKFYSKIDNTFEDKVKLDDAQYMSVCMQLSYAFYVLHKSGWIHNDLHPGNIGFCKVPRDEKVKCFGESIGTCGVKLQLIDFGRVLGRRFDLTKREIKTLESGRNDELFQSLLMVTTDMGKVWADTYAREGIETYEKRLKLFGKSTENKILKSLLPDKDSRFLLSSFLYPGKFAPAAISYVPGWMLIWMFANAITTKKSHYMAFFNLFMIKNDENMHK